jgi:hypothetical protein
MMRNILGKYLAARLRLIVGVGCVHKGNYAIYFGFNIFKFKSKTA